MNLAHRVNDVLPYGQLSTWAIVGGACGLVAAVPALPSALSALLLLAFIFLGPGSVGMHWVPEQPPLAVRALVPVLGLAIVILLISGLLFMNVYSPRLSLLAMAVVTVGLGLYIRATVRAAEPVTV